jgi:hypothetical protein
MSKIRISKSTPVVLFALFALFLRVYQSAQVPPSLNAEELSVGWNAVAIRFAAILFGSFTVIGVYFFVRQAISVFAHQQDEVEKPIAAELQKYLPALSSLLLAISPWHIQLSRAAAQPTIALFFVVWGAYWLLSAPTHPARYSLAFLPFVLALYSDTLAGIFGLFLGIGLVVTSFAAMRKNLRRFIGGAAIACIALLPLGILFFTPGSPARIFASDPALQPIGVLQKPLDNGILEGMVHSQALLEARAYMLRVSDYFQPDFLFVHGDPDPQYSLQDVGLFYLVDALFIAIGVYTLLRYLPGLAVFGGLWIAGAAFLAGASAGPLSSLKFEITLPIWHMTAAAGILACIAWLKGARKIIAVVFLALIYAYSLGYFVNDYFFHYPLEFSAEWTPGKQAGPNRASSEGVVFPHEPGLVDIRTT